MNYGVFRANQSRVYRRNLITTISDEVWDKLEDPDTQIGFVNGFLLRTIFQEVPFLLESMVYLRNSNRLGGPKGEALSHRRRWLVQQTSYIAFSQVSWRGGFSSMTT